MRGQRLQDDRRSRQLHAAALAATAGVDLGLDDPYLAAEILGINRNTLRKKIRDLDIQVSRAP
mgnify:CR=1 FL=1